MLSNCKIDGLKAVSDLHISFKLMLNVAPAPIGTGPEIGKTVEWWRLGDSNP